MYSFTIGTSHEAEALPAGAGNLHLSYSTPKTFGTGETQVAGGGLPSMNMPWNQDWEGKIAME
jgi:hypothetical protein